MVGLLCAVFSAYVVLLVSRPAFPWPVMLAAALLASAMNALTSVVLVHFAVAACLLLLLIGSARGGLLTEDRAPAEQQEDGEGGRREQAHLKTPGRTIPTGCRRAG